MARKRSKRRSSGKTKKSGFPWGKICLGLFLCLLLVVFLGIFFIRNYVEGYVRSPELALKVQKKLGVALKAEPYLDRPSWTGSTAFSRSFEAIGGEGAFFSELEIESIRTDIDLGQIEDGVMTIPLIEADHARLEISDGRHGEIPEPDPPLTGLAARFAPKKVVLEQAQVENLLFEYNRNGTKIRIADTRATLRPQLEAQALDLDARGGTLHLPGVPVAEIRDLRIRIRKEGIFIKHAELDMLGDALAEGDGEIGFAPKPGFKTTLQISDIDVKELVKEQWKGRIAGLATTKLESRKDGRRDPEAAHEGSFEIFGGVVRDLPVLDKLAEHTRDDRFRVLDLSVAEGEFRKKGDRLELRDLNLQKESLIRLTGDADIEGGNIEGVFQVGVSPGTLRWIPGAERKVFTEKRDGFVWTTFRLSGPLASPREDLSARLKAGAVEAVVEDTVQAGVDTAVGVADAGVGLIKGAGGVLGAGPEGQEGDDKKPDGATGPLGVIGEGTKAVGKGVGKVGSEVIGAGKDAATGAVKDAARAVSEFLPILPGLP